MSSSEELSQYEEKSAKTFKSLNETAEENDHSIIPRDMFGLYGVHVSNLPEDISERVLSKTFSAVGRVAVCKIMEPKARRASQPEFFPYAFVKFTTSKEAHSALSKFDGYELNGSILAVRPAFVSEKPRKNYPFSNAKQHHDDKSSEEDSNSSSARKRDESQGTKYVMGSSDCRLKDGRLQDADVMTFNGTSNKTLPPKKVNGVRELAPRFRKDSPAVSLETNASQDSRNFQGVPPPRVSSVPPAPTVHRQNETIHQQPTISGFQTSPGNLHNNTESSITANLSAFRPYQGTPIPSNQEVGMQKPASMENGVANVASSFSHLGLSSLNQSVAENNNVATWNHSQGSDTSSWRQGGSQGVTSWSQTGGTGVMLWSNGRDRPITSPDRNQSAPDRSPQARPSVSFWSTADVVQFFLNSDCAEYAGFFQEQEIDGRALMLLNRDTLLQFMKVGPALKVLQLIDELKACGPHPVAGSNGW
ncbi:uncharacterized protein LOC144628923 [Oculina patagonica]